MPFYYNHSPAFHPTVTNWVLFVFVLSVDSNSIPSWVLPATHIHPATGDSPEGIAIETVPLITTTITILNLQHF